MVETGVTYKQVVGTRTNKLQTDKKEEEYDPDQY